MSNTEISFNRSKGTIQSALRTERYLKDLRDIYSDHAAFDAALAQANPLVYRVDLIEPAQGEGALHYGIGTIMPGRVGDEYYMTKGHYHSWRSAAEVYIGLSGRGAMLLEHEATGECQLLPLGADSVVYVPGFTAHRTINTADEPLVYMGVFPAMAGHDYDTIAQRGFRMMVVERDGTPLLIPRL